MEEPGSTYRLAEVPDQESAPRQNRFRHRRTTERKVFASLYKAKLDSDGIDYFRTALEAQRRTRRVYFSYWMKRVHFTEFARPPDDLSIIACFFHHLV